MKPIATTRTATGMPTGKLAVWWVIASEIVIFGGLLGSYIMYRLSHPHWADFAAHTNTWAGGFNTLVLLTSSLFAVPRHLVFFSGAASVTAHPSNGQCEIVGYQRKGGRNAVRLYTLRRWS